MTGTDSTRQGTNSPPLSNKFKFKIVEALEKTLLHTADLASKNKRCPSFRQISAKFLGQLIYEFKSNFASI